MSSRFEKTILANYKKSDRVLTGTNIQIIMPELTTWYARFLNLADEFSDGEYLVKVSLKSRFPQEAPDVQMLTPNGVYEINGTVICTGYGAHHQHTYTPAKGIHGVLGSVLGNMLDWQNVSHGIGFIKSDTALKQKLAKQSKPYNRKYYDSLISQFEEKYGK